MGQNCIKSAEVATPPKQAAMCNKCHNPIIEPNAKTHKCLIITKLQDTKPVLTSSKASISVNTTKIIQQPGAYKVQGEEFKIKVFNSPERTKTHWSKEQTWYFPIKIRDLFPNIVKNLSFQEKLYWFRLNIQRLRISWQNGSEKINVDRSNILMSSKTQLQKINLRKQVKIIFNDQSVDDAGGLMRQYMHLALKEIFSPDTGIFEKSQCQQLFYRFKWDTSLVEEYVKEYMKVLGLIVGKALFERISINCYLDRTILRQLCGGPVHLQDFYTYDQHTYNSLKNILQTIGASQVALNFCLYHQDSGSQNILPVQLIPKGQQITVNDQNKYQYTKLLIHQYCTLSCAKYLEQFRRNVYKVVPAALLSIFEPVELEMILNGPSDIDINDWKLYTQYRGYKANDKQIKWFWQFVQKLPQQKLRNLLHYTTGTSRVPILGFKYLQSNRNQIVRFTIQRAEYNKQNPYPKSYTCFNRLHLPTYDSKKQMAEKLYHVTNNQLTHFGLD